MCFRNLLSSKRLFTVAPICAAGFLNYKSDANNIDAVKKQGKWIFIRKCFITNGNEETNRVAGVHMERMILFGGQSHPAFTRTLADRLGVEVRVTGQQMSSSPNVCQVGSMQQETFSNKEHSLQIQESVHGKDVYIVQTGRGGPLGDSELVEVLTMVHTAKINSAASVTVVMPNYPFSRSDKVTK